MRHKIVIAVDSFKGSLTAHEAAEALGRGVREVLGECEVVEVALADGGEGSAEIITRALGGERIAVSASDPLGRKIVTHYGILGEGVAVVDVASAAALTLLRKEERNPLLTSSRGVGEVVRDALLRGCRCVILGVGGSATNDCGTGLLVALGYRFLDSEGREVEPCGGNLHLIESIDSSGALEALGESRFILAVDVRNPFCGAQGAAQIYAPQKGATAEMVAQLDAAMLHFADIVERHCGVDIRHIEGGGAAGGIGGTLYALLGASLPSGAKVVAECVGFDRHLEGCDLVITGEGAIDHQTTMGKVPYEVLQRCLRRGVRVVAIGGKVVMCEELERCGFEEIIAATPPKTPLHEALECQVAKHNLFLAAQRVAQKWIKE